MIGKFLFFLSAATAIFLGLSAGAVTTSQNVDIIVTHGAPLTTFTFVNNTGNTIPAGSPVSFGQAFRYGDIMPGTYPLIRDASTHVALLGQQWDEIAAWHENGGNGSWRHAVWAAWLPNSLANGATYQVEFVPTAGTYSQSSHQALSALCSGPAAHNLKIHLTDVRNQNDTVRDSGDATFRLCDNILNVGRDAPRHLRAGNVYDEYVVSGMFVYATSGHQDPLLYAQCNVDIFTKASDGVSAGDVRWVCHVHNSWENVAAGSTGNAGNPGPAGFANDPQAISYRPEIDDGASDVLDWSGLDATISSASNPVSPAAGTGCGNAGGNYCMFVPSSLGANAWYYGQATRASCATCIGGVTNGQLYYIWPSSSSVSTPPNTQYVALMLTPSGNEGGSVNVLTGAQGTGTTTFSTRVQHYHWESWQTLDASGQDNWSPFGSTTRVTRKIYPAFTSAEKLYWEETGLIIPINVSQPTPTPPILYGYGLGNFYEPFGRLDVIGTSVGGPRPDLGISGEFATTAFITEAQQDWDLARLFTLGTSMHGYSTLLNESTGRISVLNNGPPVGPGGNGNGGSYAGLGAPQNQLGLLNGQQTGPAGVIGIADAVRNQPNPSYDISGGLFQGGTGIDHMPSFDGFTYMVFGDRHFLDLMQWHGNRDFLQQRVGPGPELGQGYYRDNNATFTDGNVYHYWGLLTLCCQTRGSDWLIRDVTYAATFGGDNNIERSYFNDIVTETSNYWPLHLKYKDGPGSTGYSHSTWPPVNDLVTDNVLAVTFFQVGYVSEVSYIMQTFLHVPMAGTWNTALQRFTEGLLGSQLPNAPVSYYVAGYQLQPAVQNGDGFYVGFGGSIGQYVNGTDGADFGWFASNWLNVLTGGQVQAQGGGFTITAGDSLKMLDPWYGYSNLDQLPGLPWFEIMGPIDNVNKTFYIKCPLGHAVDATCPTPGAAFTGFSRGGSPVSNEVNTEVAKYRFSYDPGAGQGYQDNNYTQYAGQVINGLHVLGYNVAHATSDFNTRAGTAYYNPQMPSFWWDPTIVVPGLPAAHNGL
jgi:hypothetical protein